MLSDTTISHYIPAFTQQIGRRQRAFCGVLIDPRDHANEPTCPNCQHILEQDAEQFAAFVPTIYDKGRDV